MTERRRFSARERVALYLAADGKCTECGTELKPGWHADHVQPWSRDGETDVINGQALCPPCNLKKGNRVSELRQWQSEAFGKFLRTTGDFLLVATPGAGKTRFALTVMQRLIEMGEIDRIIVVVPTSHLRKQWAKAAADLGIQLDKTFTNGAGALASDFDGAVVTYSAVASARHLYRKITSSSKTLVVLDEVHHGGDELAWGDALRYAFEPAVRRLLLSGTPRRTDRKPVPFVTYDEDGNFVWSHKYDYGEALSDRTVVRPVEFLAMDGEMRWREAGAITAMALVDAEGDSLSNALGAALNPDGDWIVSVLRRANDELSRHRADVPDAGGLIVAADQDKARRYAAMITKISGEDAVIATTDEPDASHRITTFTSGTARWLVAVQMVSEGVDIPRLTVGVYASRFRTDLFFRQVVGRFVRMRSADDPITATLLIPAIEPLIRYAQEIEVTVTKALDEEEAQTRREMKERDSTFLFDLVEPLDSSEAVHYSTILAGESFTDEELQRAQVMHQAAGMPAAVAVAQVARLLRMAGAGRVVGKATVKPSAPARNLADEKVALRRLINRKVGRVHKDTEEPYSHIYVQLSKLTDKGPVNTATAEMLERRLAILDEWIEKG